MRPMRETGNPFNRTLGADPILDPIMEKILPYVKELSIAASEKIKPVVLEALDEYTPKFAILTGLVAGSLVIVGLLLGKKIL